MVLYPGAPEGSTGCGSDFKASQKTGPELKVSSDRLGEAGNRTCDPWFTRRRFIYTTAAYRQIKKFIALSLSDVVFIMLINFKMPTNVAF